MTVTDPQGPPAGGFLLNDSQQRAVSSDSLSLLILAGPGSGKTRCIVERIKRLIADGAPPDHIAAITYTVAAAAEIQSRLDGTKLGYAGTLHGFMLRLIQHNASTLGFHSSRLSVLSEEQEKALREKCAEDVKYRGSDKDLILTIGLAFRAILPAEFSALAKTTCGQAAIRYVNTLRRNSLVSFDSILDEGLRLLRISRAPFRDDFTFGYLLVDETQDASNLDFRIYNALPIANKCYVADPDQSIYQFRGGNPTNIVAMAESGDCDVITLEQNYRCGQAICDAANRLIRHNVNRVDKETVSATDYKGEVEVVCFDNDRAEMRAVAALIDETDGWSCAVLLRTNALVDQWTEYLTGLSVPVARRTVQAKPSDWPKARTAVALMVDPTNEWLVLQYLTTKVGPVYAEHARLNATARGEPIGCSDIPTGLPIASYSQTLAQIGASPESVEIVEKAIATLPAGATGSDLLLALNQSEDSQEVGAGVHVGTIHGAKGREFDCVFLPAVEQEIIPGTAKSRSIEEERRLLFVGITRARYHITISYARERKPAYGSPKPVPATPSQFLRELQP